MEIELPDGTVLEGVPEGTSRATILSKLGGRYGLPTSEIGPAPAMSARERVGRFLSPVIGETPGQRGERLGSLAFDPSVPANREAEYGAIGQFFVGADVLPKPQIQPGDPTAVKYGKAGIGAVEGIAESALTSPGGLATLGTVPLLSRAAQFIMARGFGYSMLAGIPKLVDEVRNAGSEEDLVRAKTNLALAIGGGAALAGGARPSAPRTLAVPPPRLPTLTDNPDLPGRTTGETFTPTAEPPSRLPVEPLPARAESITPPVVAKPAVKASKFSDMFDPKNEKHHDVLDEMGFRYNEDNGRLFMTDRDNVKLYLTGKQLTDAKAEFLQKIQPVRATETVVEKPVGAPVSPQQVAPPAPKPKGLNVQQGTIAGGINDFVNAIGGKINVSMKSGAAKDYAQSLKDMDQTVKRQAFTTKGGMSVDEAAQAARDRGLIAQDASTDDFLVYVNKLGQAMPKEPGKARLDAEAKAHVAFTETIGKPGENKDPVSSMDMTQGDKFTIGGEKYHAKPSPQPGMIEIVDGQKVTLPIDATIYVDKGSFKEATTAPTPKSATEKPVLNPNTGQSEVFTGGDTLSLVGEKGVDFARRQAEAQAKAAAQAEAAKQQTQMFSTGGGGTAGTLGGQPLAPASPYPISATVKGQREIINDLGKGLNIPIRFGRLTTPKFGGYFKKLQNLIGAKYANDIPVTSHEAGHKIDAMFKLSENPVFRGELEVLGDPSTPGSRSSWTPSKNLKYKRGEGVGEFIRYWLTDPPTASKMAPAFEKHFNSILDANPDVGDVLRTARNDIRNWRTSPPEARMDSSISVGGNPNGTPYRLSQLTRDVVDDLHFVRLAVDDAGKLGKRSLTPINDPYVLARNLRGSYGMADSFIRTGVVDFKTGQVKMGTSFEHALKPVAGRVDQFRRWIVAKQAQELRKQGKETGLVKSDVDYVAAKYEADPQFQEAFQKVKAWQDAILQYAVDAGHLTADSAAAMRKMNQDYVPFHRLFEIGAGESPSVQSQGTGRGLNVGRPASFQRRTGSTRDIVDPLETMIKNAYVIVTASEKSLINTAVANLSRRPGMGKWVEEIRAPQENVKVGLEKIREQLEDAGADLSAVPDDLLVNFFRQSGQAPFGENVIRISLDGKPKFYRLKSELFEAFHALSLEDSSTLMRILSAPAQVLRAGVTLTPDFALANLMRDAVGSAVINKYGMLPFEASVKGMAAMLRNPKLVAEWKAAGGEMAIEANYFDRPKLSKYMREKITKELTPAERATIVAKHPLMALRWLTGTLESATRIGEYKKDLSENLKRGMPENEARRLAAFNSRDRQDFAKGGAKTKILRHMTAFWNASLQAEVKLVQSFRQRPLRTTLQGLAYITTAKLIEQAINWDDEDYWDRPQWERDLFFLIPFAKDDNNHTRFIRIPTPFTPGIIFGTIPGRIIQSAKQHNPKPMKEALAPFLRNAVPNPLPQAVQVIFSDFLSGAKGWDIYRGRSVVPENISKLPAEDQWTEQTSLTARKVGRALGFSPMKVDHIIAQSTGGLGRQITHQGIDRAISVATGEKRTAASTAPGMRFISTPAGITSESVNQFYDELEKLREQLAGAKTNGQPMPNGAKTKLYRMESAAIMMTALRKQALAQSDPAAKQRFYLRIAQIAKQSLSPNQSMQTILPPSRLPAGAPPP